MIFVHCLIRNCDKICVKKDPANDRPDELGRVNWRIGIRQFDGSEINITLTRKEVSLWTERRKSGLQVQQSEMVS